MGLDYKSSGVDIEAGYRSVELMKQYVSRTMRPEVMGGLGGFSGAFSLEKVKKMEKPVLLSGTDGVGTKLKIAFLMDKHDTVGIDCVAMCVNDVACAGGEPLFFLDYIACGKNVPEKIAQIVSGVCEGCVQSDAALIGGETAEMPGFYPVDEYDLAGFAVGVADEKDLITGADIKPGDKLVGIASSGVHSNGFSLVRKVFDVGETNLKRFYPELGATLGDTLLTPTRIYVKALRAVREAGIRIKGCSHITGGGFYENIPRMLPDGIVANVKKDSYPILPIFTLMQKKGGLEEKMMYNTFNMGIGMVLALESADAELAVEVLRAAGEEAYVIGETAAGSRKGVELC
jgi:phosphoribosylformylglycinamidine cyclo-ligase